MKTPSPKQLKIRCSTRNPPFVVPSKLLVTQQHPVCGTISARRAIPLRGLRLGSPFSAKGSLDCCEGMGQSFPTLACILSTDQRCMFMFVDNASAVFEDNQFGVRACCLYIRLVGTCLLPLTFLGNYNKRLKYPDEE